MKKILKWLMINKAPCSGFLALLLYFVDNIFHVTENLGLPTGGYYTVVAFLFLLIGYTIKGKGFKSLDSLVEDVIKEQKEEDLKNKIKKVVEIIEKENDKEEISKQNSS